MEADNDMTVYMVQVNIVEFPSLAQAHAWYTSPEYAKALVYRKGAVLRRLFFVPGTDELATAEAGRQEPGPAAGIR